MVAAVSGWALGSGCELALACDLAVAAEKTQFGQPEITLGIIPGGGATQRLARALGKQRAMGMILTGRRFSAEQALTWGMINSVAPQSRWLETAWDLAAEIAARAPIATRLAKQAVLAAEREPLDQGMELERKLFEQAMATEDRIEGMNAFMQGRRPEFEGR
jgi:enoyl-CoA hydratase